MSHTYEVGQRLDTELFDMVQQRHAQYINASQALSPADVQLLNNLALAEHNMEPCTPGGYNVVRRATRALSTMAPLQQHDVQHHATATAAAKVGCPHRQLGRNQQLLAMQQQQPRELA